VACNRPSVPLPSAGAANGNSPQSEPTRAAAVQFLPVNGTVAWAPITTCNFEYLDGKEFAPTGVEVKKGAEFLATGFLFSQPTQSVPTTTRIRAVSKDGARSFEAQVSGRYDRPDVPGYFKIGDWALHSGFEQLLSSQGLPPGSYHLLLVFEDKGQAYVCDNGRQLVVTP
jgi:hypothetical protein